MGCTGAHQIFPMIPNVPSNVYDLLTYLILFSFWSLNLRERNKKNAFHYTFKQCHKGAGNEAPFAGIQFHCCVFLPSSEHNIIWMRIKQSNIFTLACDVRRRQSFIMRRSDCRPRGALGGGLMRQVAGRFYPQVRGLVILSL